MFVLSIQAVGSRRERENVTASLCLNAYVRVQHKSGGAPNADAASALASDLTSSPEGASPHERDVTDTVTRVLRQMNDIIMKVLAPSHS